MWPSGRSGQLELQCIDLKTQRSLDQSCKNHHTCTFLHVCIMLSLAAIVITKCVILFSQQPSVQDGVVDGTKPWINSKARRVWRTRWRGSLGWDHRVLRINRAKPNHLSSSSQMTSSRWAEHNKPLYMFRAQSHFLPHVLHHNHRASCFFFFAFLFYPGAPPWLRPA